ncbi:hypothetical protein [Bacteriovorax sp. Seq25_V]|uniref:hypothetical protein n=1 Tax=Bacteriovorax sp. Seq25_V TaxID=1201288 RepID=UPI000389F115|nr:hypothetical protein [Bacteriovorax sp. Seq25_V]EQC47578.1 hypothetical protein M900_0852 [Bacteriovorax sp. Seq25_V]
MNNLIDIFTKHIFELYGVTENQAHFLFERWKIAEKYDEMSVQKFLESDDIKPYSLSRKILIFQKNIQRKNLRL